jgi:hypothetical protein
VAAGAALLTAGLVACTASGPAALPAGSPAERVSGGPDGTYVVAPGIHKIKHVIIVMQENRSFDSYFGTYPGADGIAMSDGTPTACVPNPAGGCTRPYHDTADVNGGGPHGEASAVADVDGGRMDGFIAQRDKAEKSCANPDDPACAAGGLPDVMGYHTGAEIPNYWTYAKDFVLPGPHVRAGEVNMVSAWSARCKSRSPMSCVNNIVGPYGVAQFDKAVNDEVTDGTTSIDLAWTDITWLLFAHHVSWAPGIWNPLPLFGDVHADHQLGNIQDLTDYFSAAKAGTLPSVSWITPSGPDSEHPPASVHRGQAYVTSIINAAMESPDWDSTVIFLSWDDWGGLDQNGYGLRVPGLVISPYARQDCIDHQTLSSDAYLKFIEDDFLGGQRLDPATDGRPDPRPDVREDAPGLGNIDLDFNFSQAPRPPVLLATNPPTDSPSIPAYFTGKPACAGCTVPPPAPGPANAQTPSA